MMLAAFIICACLSQEASPLKTFTFEARATRASVLIQHIATISGLRLETDSALANEILVVIAKGLPVDTLLQKLAIVTSSEWHKSGPVLKLVPSSVALKRLKSEDIAKGTAILNKAIADSVHPAAELTSDEGQLPLEEPDPQIAQFLKGLDLAPIVLLKPGARLVFSTSPNNSQRRLGDAARDLVASIVKKHDDVGATDSLSTPQSRNTTTVGRALLVVTKRLADTVEMVELELRIYDEDRKVICSFFDSLAMQSIAPTSSAANDSSVIKRRKDQLSNTQLVLRSC